MLRFARVYHRVEGSSGFWYESWYLGFGNLLSSFLFGYLYDFFSVTFHLGRFINLFMLCFFSCFTDVYIDRGRESIVVAAGVNFRPRPKQKGAPQKGKQGSRAVWFLSVNELYKQCYGGYWLCNWVFCFLLCFVLRRKLDRNPQISQRRRTTSKKSTPLSCWKRAPRQGILALGLWVQNTTSLCMICQPFWRDGESQSLLPDMVPGSCLRLWKHH